MNTVLHHDPEVATARQQWLNYLKEPGRKKAQQRLVSYVDYEARCCLGHACEVLGAEFTSFDENSEGWDDGFRSSDRVNGYKFGKEGVAETRLTPEIAEKLDLDATGGFREPVKLELSDDDTIQFEHDVQTSFTIHSMASLNDETHFTPYQIAVIIEAQMRENNVRDFSEYGKTRSINDDEMDNKLSQ